MFLFKTLIFTKFLYVTFIFTKFLSKPYIRDTNVIENLTFEIYMLRPENGYTVL